MSSLKIPAISIQKNTTPVNYRQNAATDNPKEEKSFGKELLTEAAIASGIALAFPFIGLLDGDSFKDIQLPKKGFKTLGVYAAAAAAGYSLYKTADHFTQFEDKKKEGLAKLGLKSFFLMLGVPIYGKITCWDENKNFADYLKGSKLKISIAIVAAIGALPLFYAMKKMYGDYYAQHCNDKE